MQSLKDSVLRYKSKHKISYRELADMLKVQNHQSLYRWLHARPTKESIGDIVDREFPKLKR